MISVDVLQRICPRTKRERLALFAGHLDAAMKEFDISTPERAAAFLAQISHESGGFRYVREIASGDAYDTRDDLGNTHPDAVRIAAEHGSTPGRWWKGRGLIQVTGFFNYKRCGDALGLDLLHQPHLLEEPRDACRSAAWFWASKGLNELADRGDFRRITLRINGGLNGYEDRLRYWERAKEALGAGDSR